MTYYVVGLLVLTATFVAGFFVGGKHKERVMRAAGLISDAIRKV